MRCDAEHCNEPVDQTDPNFMLEVSGWERRRKEGGTNHIWDKHYTGRALCGMCALKMRTKIDPNQETLFGQ